MSNIKQFRVHSTIIFTNKSDQQTTTKRVIETAIPAKTVEEKCNKDDISAPSPSSSEAEDTFQKAWREWVERDKEETREGRISLAEAMSRRWDLLRECRSFLRENSTTWLDRRFDEEEICRKNKKLLEKEERRRRAQNKKEDFVRKMKKEERTKKEFSIQQGEYEKKRNLELAEAKQNL